MDLFKRDKFTKGNRFLGMLSQNSSPSSIPAEQKITVIDAIFDPRFSRRVTNKVLYSRVEYPQENRSLVVRITENGRCLVYLADSLCHLICDRSLDSFRNLVNPEYVDKSLKARTSIAEGCKMYKDGRVVVRSVKPIGDDNVTDYELTELVLTGEQYAALVDVVTDLPLCPTGERCAEITGDSEIFPYREDIIGECLFEGKTMDLQGYRESLRIFDIPPEIENREAAFVR